MHAVTEKFGASQKAFLIVPLVGAFFLDIANATIIQIFLATPLFQQCAGETFRSLTGYRDRSLRAQ
jgi:hypothetical protein